jgi:hypothetical protein
VFFSHPATNEMHTTVQIIHCRERPRMPFDGHRFQFRQDLERASWQMGLDPGQGF